MRSFNKIFVLSLPRCATVSTSVALAQLGVPCAHLGRIYRGTDDSTTPPADDVQLRANEHFDAEGLIRIHQSILDDNFEFDILESAPAMADYPVCISDWFERLDTAYPGSLFINVRRDWSQQKWLESLERQFVGFDLLQQNAPLDGRIETFWKVMRYFRERTFGAVEFCPDAYHAAYLAHQERIRTYFSNRSADLLEFADVSQLHATGMQRLAEMLEVEVQDHGFPLCNEHSQRAEEAFRNAVLTRRVVSKLGQSSL